MRPPRISIAGLMAIIALLGVTLAAFHSGTEISAGAMMTLALAVSGAALLGQFCARGPGKVAWAGYSTFGTGYLALCLGPWSDEHIMPYLVTTPFIDERYAGMQYTPAHPGERVWTADPSGRSFVGGYVFGVVTPGTTRFDVEHDRGTTSIYTPAQLRPISPQGYRRLCHSALSPWFGLLGALLARFLSGSHRDGSTSRPE